MKHTLRRWPLVGGLGMIAAIALLVAACGGDDKGLAVGDSAPDFSLTEASGNSVALDGYDGQDVLLYFHMADG
ncbi:MAG: redoxin domain-containing protein [Acidimicrobiia bacterium]|nr:redoxin domain-containing protein [Acidimicrobiia bacterium]